MAPIPAEIDLFTIPHCRMKELVNTYTQKVQCADFRDCKETFDLLKELHATFYEFKSHEYIENLFIMDQLKNRLKQRHIYNSAVCDCHKDNRLSKVMNLVRNGKFLRQSSIGERLNFGEELQKSFFDFVEDFLPHMEEEENIFQPLLVEHFEYDELCALKEVVIEQHELIRDPLYQEKSELDLPEFDSNIKDFRDIDSDVCFLGDLYTENSFCDESHIFKENKTETHIIKDQNSKDCSSETDNNLKVQLSNCSFVLPTEILVKIFRYLTPPDRGRCAQVCSFWNEVIYTPLLWKEIYPIQWARGIWKWEDVNLNYVVEDEAFKSNHFSQRAFSKYDEDADIDETENYLAPSHKDEYSIISSVISLLLPRVGKGVEKLVLDGGRGITSSQIRRSLILCPNLIHFSAAYTPFNHHTIKGLYSMKCFTKIRYLDLQGCVEVDDHCLRLLAECFGSSDGRDWNCSLNYCLKGKGSLYDNNDPDFLYPACPFSNCEVAATCEKACNFVSTSKQQGEWKTSLKCPYLLTDSQLDEIEIEELANIKSKSATKSSLEYVNLSGCLDLTEKGLNYLIDEGALLNITYLNVSGCFDVVGWQLNDIVKNCPRLLPKNLSYCNLIVDGPYPSEAGGCDTVNHVIKQCCQTSVN